MATPTASIAMGSQKLTGLASGSGAGDSVEYAQMNTAISTALATATSGLTWKTPVRVATTANITTLTGGAPNTVDGITLVANDRVLVKSQSTGGQNGIYTVTTLGTGANGTWTRATDADTAAELEGGVLVAVDEGTTLGNTVWMNTVDVVTIGTTAQVWTQFGAGSTYTGSLGVQLVGADFCANLGAGLTLSGNTIVPDYSAGNVFKNKVAVGFVGTSGVDVTINHALGLANKDDYLCEVVEVGVGKVMVGELSTDVNNIVLSFAVTPTSNQYRYKIVGLS
jgi:Flp pilus assembly pilin Flp